MVVARFGIRGPGSLTRTANPGAGTLFDRERHDFDLEQPQPTLARDEQAPRRRVVCDAVHLGRVLAPEDDGEDAVET